MPKCFGELYLRPFSLRIRLRNSSGEKLRSQDQITMSLFVKLTVSVGELSLCTFY